MTWQKSLAVAVLVSLATMIGAGAVAALAVDWYNISSFEGGSGFFVVGMAFLGLIGGFIIGLVTSRVMATRPKTRFVDALGASGGVVALILSIIAGASWMLADIPPLIDGEELFLLTEMRWPAGAPSPANASREPYFRLSALRGDVARKTESGPAFLEDARQEDGRWIVPGVVPIFTTRGRRLLDIGTPEESIVAFIVPLPGRPGARHREWSEWLPPAPPGASQPVSPYSYRFKVITHSEPVRTEKIGRFEIDTIASSFFDVTDSDRPGVRATFRIRYEGQRIPGVETADTVSVVGGATPGLLVTLAEPGGEPPCAWLIPRDSGVRVDHVRGCGTPLTPRLLTSDSTQFAAARSYEQLPGWIDRRLFATPGLFQLDAAVIDTRTFTASTFLFPEDPRPDTSVPPLDLSPDERSFVWLVQALDDKTQIGVTDWRGNHSYVLPIDRARMRFNTERSLTPQWIRHHFEWRRGADGRDVLVERPDVVPLPYRGDLTLAKPGEYQSYTLQLGSEPLRDAVVEILTRDLAAEPLPDEPGGARNVRVKGQVVRVDRFGTPAYVSVSISGDGSDPQVMSAIGAAIDAALATGRYDAMFVKP